MLDTSPASPRGQRVTFVELFFDLVFVFSITQIVGLLHHHLAWAAIGPSVLVFWLVWWAWTQFTWALNAADTEHRGVQGAVLLATAVAFFMAVAVPDVFEGGALWFAGPYVCVRLLGLQLYAWAASGDEAQHAAVRKFFLVSVSGLAAVIAGAALGGVALFWLWGLAIVLDIIAAAIGGQSAGWKLNPDHFVERHGLIVIIALGESLIVAAAGLAGGTRTASLVGIGALAVAISCAFWWSYFSSVRGRLEEALVSRSSD